MKSYRLQPQAKSHVSLDEVLFPRTLMIVWLQIYRSVLLTARSRRNSAGSENSRNSGTSSPNVPEESTGIRSNSTLPVPHPNSQPPTPTRLAGSGSQFEFGEERGDLILFYNQVYVPEMQEYIMKFSSKVSSLLYYGPPFTNPLF